MIKILDYKARKLIFLGYLDGTKGYRPLDKDNERVYICKDVIVIEGDPHIKAIESRNSA